MITHIRRAGVGCGRGGCLGGDMGGQVARIGWGSTSAAPQDAPLVLDLNADASRGVRIADAGIEAVGIQHQRRAQRDAAVLRSSAARWRKDASPAWTQPNLPLSMGTPVSDRGPKPPQYPLGVPVSGGGWKPAAPVQPKLMANPSESNRDRQQPPGSGGGWQNDHRDWQAGPSLPASGRSGGGGGSVSNPDKMPKQRCLAGRSGAAGGVAFGLRRVWPVARIQRCPAPSGSGFRQAVGRHGAVQMGL